MEQNILSQLAGLTVSANQLASEANEESVYMPRQQKSNEYNRLCKSKQNHHMSKNISEINENQLQLMCIRMLNAGNMPRHDKIVFLDTF